MSPGGGPGLQNQWAVASSRRRWVRLPSTPVEVKKFGGLEGRKVGRFSVLPTFQFSKMAKF